MWLFPFYQPYLHACSPANSYLTVQVHSTLPLVLKGPTPSPSPSPSPELASPKQAQRNEQRAEELKAQTAQLQEQIGDSIREHLGAKAAISRSRKNWIRSWPLEKGEVIPFEDFRSKIHALKLKHEASALTSKDLTSL